MKFELKIGRYLSISAPLTWNDIPPFAVLTGPNGSGKTQLLQLIKRAAQDSFAQPRSDGIVTSLEGVECGPNDVAFLSSEWSLPDPQPVTLQHIEQQTQDIVRGLLGSDQSPMWNAFRREMREELENYQDPDTLAQALPSRAYLWQHRYPGAAIHQLGLVFRNYYLDETDLLRGGLGQEEAARRLGPPPWQILNDLLAASSIPYRVSTPVGLKVRDPYVCRLFAQDSGAVLSPHNLSSGERILFGMILSLFTSTRFNLHSKLLLLDEPDAHLHTAQIAGFLKMLRSKLVEEYGCRVILTTHRPDTVVQTRQGELFEMSRTGEPRVRAVRSHSAVLSTITSHIVDILPATRCVYVEDDDDALFYEHVRDTLLVDRSLDESPALIFKSSGIGRGDNRTSGGRGTMRKSVEKLRSAGLSMVVGIEDEDNQPHRPLPSGIYRIGRYSFENYLYDPLLMFLALVDLRAAPLIPAVGPFAPGEESRFVGLSADGLQSVADTIVSMLDPHLPQVAQANRNLWLATLVTGQEIRLPGWVRTLRGHDLKALAIAKLHSGLTQRTLLHTMLRSRLVYEDLRKVLKGIQYAA